MQTLWEGAMTIAKRWRYLLCFTLFGLPAAPALAESEHVHPLADALLRDSEVTLHFRSHYLNRPRRHQPDSLAWAAGGWVGYRSGWLGDTLRIGLTGNTSQKLHGPADKDGAALLLTDQRSYQVMGEAYGALKLADQVLTAGRFIVNQFEVNPQDTRMTPRSFRGAALNGKVQGVDYYLARFDQMKSRNWDNFEPIAFVVGAPQVDSPLYLLSLRGKSGEDWSWGFATYHVPDLLTSSFAEGAWTTPLSGDTRLRLGGQLFRQGSIGRHALTGSDFETGTIGLKADLLHGPFTLSAIVMQTDRGAAYRMPFGSWPGYASRIINNFNRAGERVHAIDAAVDFARLGTPGLSMNASATFGTRAINANSGARLSENREFNVTADYRFTAAHWPEWSRPLALRARAARFEQRWGGPTDVTKEYHLILNYTVTFK